MFKQLLWVIRKKRKNTWFYRRIYEIWQSLNGSSISWYARFAGEPCFPHGMKGIFISGAAKLGKDCVIFHQVTIGSNTLIESNNKGAPIIGDSCYIGAGAKIIGKLKIGNNVRIGANTVVYKDVPDNCVVVSGEMKIIPKEGLDNRYYYFPEKWKCFEDGCFHDVTDERLDKLKRM